MESWVLEGDSYSFLCTSPNNLQHLDGPNLVEIFDITAIPSTRSAISETTCLCDIFGDDCESPILSSSPTSASILKGDVNKLPNEINDSSGSYHTAHDTDQTIDGSDTFDDSKDTVQNEASESILPQTNLILPLDKTQDTLVAASCEPINVNESDLTKIKKLPELSLPQDFGSVQVENTHTSKKPETPVSINGSVTFQPTPTKLHYRGLSPAGLQKESELPQNSNNYFSQDLTMSNIISSDATVSNIKVYNKDMSVTKDHRGSYSSQDDCPEQKEKITSSDQQIKTSGFGFQDTDIKPTDSTLNINTPEHLSENESIIEESETISCELKESECLETIGTNQLPESGSPIKVSDLPSKEIKVMLDTDSPAPVYVDNNHLSLHLGNQQESHLSQDSGPVRVDSTYTCNQQARTSTSDAFYDNSLTTSDKVLDSVLLEIRQHESQLPWNGIPEQIKSTSDMTPGNGSVTEVKVNDNTLLQTEDLQESYCSQDDCLVETENPKISAADLTQEIINPDLLAKNEHMAEQTDAASQEPVETNSEDTVTQNKAISTQHKNVLSESWESNPAVDTTAPSIIPEKQDDDQSNITVSVLNETHSMQEDTLETTSCENDFSQRKLVSPPNTLLELVCDITQQDDAVLSGQWEFDPVQGVTPLTEHLNYISSEPEEIDLIQQNDQLEKQCSDNKEHTILSNSSVKLSETPEKNMFSSPPREKMVNIDCSLDMPNVLPKESDLTCFQTCISTPEETCKEMSPSIINKDIPCKSEHRDAVVRPPHEPLNILQMSEDDRKSCYPEITEKSTNLNNSLAPSAFTFCAETYEEYKRSSPISNVSEGPKSPDIDEFYSFGGTLTTASSTEPSIIIHSPVGFTSSPSPEQQTIYSAEPEACRYTCNVQETPTTYLDSCDSNINLTSEFSSMNSILENKQNDSVLIPELESATSFSEICGVESQNSVTHQKDVFHRVNSPQNNPQAQSQDFSDDGIKNMITLPISTLSGPSSSENLSVPDDTCFSDVDGVKCDESCTLTTLSTNEITDPSMPLISDHLLTQDGIAGPLLTSSSPLDIFYPETGAVFTKSSGSVALYDDEITNRSLSSTPKSLSTQEDLFRSPSTSSLPGDLVPSEGEAISIEEIQNVHNSTYLQSTLYELENTFNEKGGLAFSAQGYVDQFENAMYSDQIKSCRPALEKFTDITLGVNQIQKINNLLPEPNCEEMSITQIDQNPNGSSYVIEDKNVNTLEPWKTPQINIPVPNTMEENLDLKAIGTLSGKEILKRRSACNQMETCQRGVRLGLESPSVLHSINDSKYERQSSSNKGRSRNWMRPNELTSLKGVENIEGSYRGGQVELSLSARNRRGLTNLNPAPSSRDPRSEIPVCYFESPLATREQQTLKGVQSFQEEKKSGARGVRSASQSNYSGTGNLSSECASEAFSMGSEFDDTDSEVKWFTDQAYSSLSSSQGDYLDIYNSSHGSSTNISQQSTMDSPRASTWNSCADLYDAALHNNNNVLLYSNSFLPAGTSDSTKCFEMDSFECVDIAVESKEEGRRGKRTVPKRQIQFKRLDFSKLKPAEDAENILELPFTQDCSRNNFVSQQSSASTVQEDLHKTLSFNKTSTKAQTASTIIKSVLSKKMDSSMKESSKCEGLIPDGKHQNAKHLNETLPAEKTEKQSPGIQSEMGLLLENNGDKDGKSPYSQRKTYRPKVPPKPAFRVGSRPLSSKSKVHDKRMESEIKPVMSDSFVRKTPKKQVFENTKKKTEDMGETYSSDSACCIEEYPNPTYTRAASMQGRITNRDIKQVTPEFQKQPDLSRTFLSKTSEISLKPCTINDKDVKSFKQPPLSSDMKISKALRCEPQPDKIHDEQKQFQTPVEVDSKEDSDKNKSKSVIHKVRDVRKLVKNTYNLSFAAASATQLEEDQSDKENKDMQPHPQRLHIEYKAISWKDKQNSCSKISNILDETSTKVSQIESEITKTPERDNTNVQILEKQDYILESSNSVCEPDTKLEMPPRPSSKEVSMLVYVKDETPKGPQKTVSSSHSVSMLVKEKGMQADIGVCDVLNEGAGAKTKHVNKIEVPLQTYGSEVTTYDSPKVEKEEVRVEQRMMGDISQRLGESVLVVNSIKSEEIQTEEEHKQDALLQSKEQVLIPMNAMMTAKNPAPLISVNKAEVKTFSSTTKSHAKPVTTSKEIELPIQVRSVTDRPKPSVLPKPNFKPPFAETRSLSNDPCETYIKPATTILKQQTHLNIDKIKSTALPHGKQSSEAAKPTPSNTKILAVSAVSSQKPEATQICSVPSSVRAHSSTSRREVSITSVQNTCSKNLIKEHLDPTSSSSSSHQALLAESQDTSTHLAMVASAKNLMHTKDFHFPASDDPPSYDERESFSPLLLSDLPDKRLNRYHPSTRNSVCSCASCSHPNYSHPYHGLQNQAPPAAHSPGQTLSYPGMLPQAQVRPHQCKPDSLTCTPVSPTITAPQAPALIQPMQRSQTYQAQAIQPYSNDQQQPSAQQIDRRSGCQRSPQPSSRPPYREHSRSPNIAALDPRSQFFNSQEMPPAFGHDFGSEGPGNSGMVYPESGLGYGQGSRRVLLDPETGKYFYIEVPMQPLRKMLFDPEIGQYVEVVIPQQTMSHSGMYPPAAAPYPSVGGPGLYTSQYLPYAVPPHPQSAQQPRHPDHTVPTSLQQTSVGYGNSAGQKRKSDVKGHSSLDQSYLESMYYIASDMNTSTNSTSSDCYHKPSPNMPTVGRRV